MNNHSKTCGTFCEIILTDDHSKATEYHFVRSA